MDVNLGERTVTGSPLWLSEAERRRHVYLAGKTGTGKSTLLLTRIIHRRTVRRCDGGGWGVGNRGAEDAGEWGLRLRRRV